jgi:hypothetical protein
MSIFKEVLDLYSLYHKKNKSSAHDRVDQLTTLTNILEDNFKFDKIISIETGASKSWVDGMVGYYFASLANKTKGEFHSVDLSEITTEVLEAYKNINPELQINHYTQDSVEFLRNIQIIPNLVHLDSWNVDLTNPLPCALHGWREFEAIESKMPVGSIIIIDDNWFKGTYVSWNIWENDKIIKTDRIDVNYPILGKGAHIYQWVNSGDKNWKLLSTPIIGINNKIVIQKVK